MSEYKKINLPVQENGAMIWRTLEGTWILGSPDQYGRPFGSIYTGREHRERWPKGWWYVIRSASGKLVVYREPLREECGPPDVAVFDSFEAMQPHVPPNIDDAALDRAGLKPPPQFPELPLEGV